MTYSEQRKDLNYYRFIRNFLSIVARENDAIIDIGSNGVDILSHLPCRHKVSLDLELPVYKQGIQSIRQNFYDFNPPNKFDIVTSFQVMEHIPDAANFAKKMLATGHLIVVSVPYMWPKGVCKNHCQDPVSSNKLVSWFGREPLYLQVISRRLFAIFSSEEQGNLLYSFNGKHIRDFIDYMIDIDIDAGSPSKATPPVQSDFYNEEYKQAVLLNNPTLASFANMTSGEIAKKAAWRKDLLSRTDFNEDYLKIGMLLYPFVLDGYGHPLFIKEYTRFLVNNGRWDEARNLLKDKNLPSLRLMPITWAKVLFTRAAKLNKTNIELGNFFGDDS